jgi:hypothetical protein
MIENKPVTLAAGYAFCSACGGLFKLEDKSKLPPHVAVGRGQQGCTGGVPAYDGEISP